MMTLEAIRELVQNDFNAVNQYIETNLRAQLGLIQELSGHIIKSGGKRLRPLIVLLSAKAHNYTGNMHITLAAAIEYFHTATLLHDDVIDESKLRRGKETANNIWGSKASILVGDYLFTQAFQASITCEDWSIQKILIETADTITRGEVQQLLNCHNTNTTQAEYFEVIRNKTAILFAAAAKVGAMISKKPENEVAAMAAYGLHLGNAFQLIDDSLDYCGEQEEIGKNIGDDLAEGKLTLPLIHALKHGSAEQQQAIRQALQQGNRQDLSQVIATLKTTHAIEYTYQLATEEAQLAISALNPVANSIYKTALIDLAHFAVARKQ